MHLGNCQLQLLHVLKMTQIYLVSLAVCLDVLETKSNVHLASFSNFSIYLLCSLKPALSCYCSVMLLLLSSVMLYATALSCYMLRHATALH